MEIGKRIREHRAAVGMSQDDLATRIYVSRQTISSWENDKTYPDVQSLLLLSEVFDATADSLIKGDVDTMTEIIDTDAKTMRRLGWVMTGFLTLTFAAAVWFAVQTIVWDWPLAHALPTLVLALAFWGASMFAAIWADRIKKEHDLITYSEIAAFWRGEPVDRDTERGRRERLIPRWMKIIRAVGMMLIFLAIGAFLGYGVSMLVDRLFG